MELVVGQLPGSMLASRFLVQDLIDKGSCGAVYACTDLTNKDAELVIKVQYGQKYFEEEVQAMLTIGETPSKGCSTPVVHFCGTFAQQQSDDSIEVHSFVVMTRYG